MPNFYDPVTNWAENGPLTYTPLTINQIEQLRHLTPEYVNVQDCANTITTKIFSSKDIDELARKIYKVFSEHISIDISEDEFMNLLEDEI